MAARPGSLTHPTLTGPPMIGVSAEVITDAQQGCPAALERLIGYVRIQALRFCRRRLAGFQGGLDIADDVTQEVCLSVCAMLPAFTPPTERGETVSLFHGWMYAIARAKVADGQRRLLRSHEPIDEVPDSADHRPTPEEAVMSTAGMATLGDYLKMLPDKTREAIMLRLHGYSAEAAGRHLGMSAAAVRVAQHRGLHRLRQLVVAEEAELSVA